MVELEFAVLQSVCRYHNKDLCGKGINFGGDCACKVCPLVRNGELRPVDAEEVRLLQKAVRAFLNKLAGKSIRAMSKTENNKHLAQINILSNINYKKLYYYED